MTVEKAARDFFCWFNRHYPAPSTNQDSEWNRLGVALVNHQEDAQAATIAHVAALEEAARVCEELDEEASWKEGRLASGRECAASIRAMKEQA